MSEYARILCPKCKADWQYGWGTAGALLKFFRTISTVMVKCFSCQLSFHKQHIVEIIEEEIED